MTKSSFNIVLLIFFLIHLSLIIIFYKQVPRSDDFDAIYDFLLKFDQVQGFSRWNLIFLPHNEHNVIFIRICALFFHYILGSVNLLGMLLIGNIFLLPTIWILGNSLTGGIDRGLQYSLIFLGFSYNSSGLFIWPTASLAFIPTLFFMVLTVRLLIQNRVLIGIVSSFLAIFSSGAGVLILPIGFFILFGERSNRRDKIIWLFYAILILLLFTIRYESIAGHPGVLDSINHPESLIKHFSLLLGSYSSGISYKLQIVAGSLSTIGILFLIFNYRKLNFQLVYYLIIPLGIALLISLSRSGIGADQALASRYAIYGNLIFFFVFVLVSQLKFVRHKLLVARLFLAISIISYCLSLRNIKEIKDFGDNQMYASAAYFDNRMQESLFFYPPDQSRPIEILTQFEEKFGYSIKKYDYPDLGRRSNFDSKSQFTFQAIDSLIVFQGEILDQELPSQKLNPSARLITKGDTTSKDISRTYSATLHEEYGIQHAFASFEGSFMIDNTMDSSIIQIFDSENNIVFTQRDINSIIQESTKEDK